MKNERKNSAKIKNARKNFFYYFFLKLIIVHWKPIWMATLFMLVLLFAQLQALWLLDGQFVEF
jgi:hypothetical protein